MITIDGNVLDYLDNVPLIEFTDVYFLQNELESSSLSVIKIFGHILILFERCSFESNIGTPITFFNVNNFVFRGVNIFYSNTAY